MAARKGAPGFTRGGMPVSVNAHPEGGGAQGPRKRKTGSPFRNFGPGEWAAVGIAGGLTGIVGAATVSALREGFGGGGAGGFNSKKTR